MCEVLSKRDATCGYWEFLFEYKIPMPEIFIPDCLPGKGWELVQHFVDLTPAATVRDEQIIVVEVVWHHCCIDYGDDLTAWLVQKKEGQLSLPLPNFEKTSPVRPASSKPRKTKSESIQLELPVTGLASELFEINYRQTGVVNSSQELLEQKTEHYSLNLRATITVHQALIDLLIEKRCSHDEWESAIFLYEVAGAHCGIRYVREIEAWREMGKSQGLTPVVESLADFQAQSEKLTVKVFEH